MRRGTLVQSRGSNSALGSTGVRTRLVERPDFWVDSAQFAELDVGERHTGVEFAVYPCGLSCHGLGRPEADTPESDTPDGNRVDRSKVSETEALEPGLKVGVSLQHATVLLPLQGRHRGA